MCLVKSFLKYIKFIQTKSLKLKQCKYFFFFHNFDLKMRISYPHSPRPYFFFFLQWTNSMSSVRLLRALVFTCTFCLNLHPVRSNCLDFTFFKLEHFKTSEPELSNLKWFYHRLFLINLHLLSSFSLWGCKLSETSCDYLFKALQTNTHLRELDLTLNNLHESHVKQLSELVDSPHHTLEVLKWVEAWTQYRLLSQYSTVSVKSVIQCFLYIWSLLHSVRL